MDELVERIRLRVGVLEHPQEVLEEHHFAADDGVTAAGAGVGTAVRALNEVLEEWVVDEVAVHDIPPARFSDVYGMESGGHIVAVERRSMPRVVLLRTVRSSATGAADAAR
ncbi:hypothetical protein IEQ34_015215 [Dendrobium chrysotoxum]|uniref:Uncharacterized protein n=1 Tax=Dendrobium chrysotoxum TaxID=161865 RepID=A0AAV7GHT6_DENCH|nr:hypothetical protein IEQ34_015215 [Dendrobium chrysotoxum]